MSTFKTGDAWFTKLREDAVIPVSQKPDSVGFDLYLPDTVELQPLTPTLVPLGLVAKPSIGYYWDCYLRSSVGRNYPGLFLANHVGIIDPDYTGPSDELALNLINMSPHVITIEKGVRLAQLVLRPALKPERIIEVPYEEILRRRPRGGWGSTGK